MAAHSAAKRGKKVTLLTAGAGSLAIGGGCIDVLGYTRCPETGKPLAVKGHVLQHISALPENHPYQIVGKEQVQAALTELMHLGAQYDYHLFPPQGNEDNHLVPTILGTLKPTYLCPASSRSHALFSAQRVLIVGIGGEENEGGGIRDCHPHLIAQQLQRYPA